MAPADYIELLQLWIWAPSHWQTNAADLLRFSEYLRDRIAGSELKVFAGGGHVHHWEALEEFNTVTTRWLVEH